jgi:MGT family glycosyltransferase
MRFLLAMFQGGGNLSLLLPVAQRLVDHGHDVRILAGPSIWAGRAPVSARFEQRIAEIGATRVAFEEPDVHPLDSAPRPMFMSRLVSIYSSNTAAYRWCPAWASNVATELARAAADVVVTDHLLPGALAGAESQGVASAALVHGIYKHRPAPGMPPPGMGFFPARGPVGFARDALYEARIEYLFRRDALPSLNNARRQHGLQPLLSPFDQYDHAARVLILCSPAFDFAAGDLPCNVRYVGTPIDDAATPAWKGPWTADDRRPLVLVSLSTLAQGQAHLMQRVLTALGTLDVRAVTTVGPSLDPTRFVAPTNVVLEPFVPHSAVLPKASAVVTQCGIGTVMKSLAHGLPLMCLPLMADQPDNAARIVAHGAGIRLHKCSTRHGASGCPSS